MGTAARHAEQGGSGATTSVRASRRIDRAFAVAVVAIFVVLWVGFAFAALGDPGFVGQGWQWLRELPAPVQLVVWIAILPIAVGLWIWESTWTPIVGFVLFGGMVAWTVVAVAGLVRAFRTA